MYHIACFPPINEHSEEEVEVVHDLWLSPGKKTCSFPPFMRGQLKRALKTGMHPDNTWKRYNMRILQSYGIEQFFQTVNCIVVIKKFLSLFTEAKHLNIE